MYCRLGLFRFNLSFLIDRFAIFVTGVPLLVTLSPDLVLGQVQVIPDDTLGADSSVVMPIDPDARQLLIQRGARRGSNLFHSFQEFSILESQGAFFENPDGVSTIFSRVTGTQASQIFGTLGVQGDANLFFLNPNGILFGPNARLELSGSFVGTTATSIDFGDGFLFSATSPQPVPILDIQVDAPVGLRFAGAEPGPILSRSELRVDDGNNLTLAGGTVASTAGLRAPAGEVNLVTVENPASVTVSKLQVGQDAALTSSDIQILNSSSELSSQPISLEEGSAVLAESSFTSISPGDVSLVVGESTVTNISTRGAGDGSGDVNIISSANLTFENPNPNVIDTSNPGANAGSVRIETNGDVQITSGNASSPMGSPNAINTRSERSNSGDVTIESLGNVTFEGVLTSVNTGTDIGKSGNVNITAGADLTVGRVITSAITNNPSATGNAGTIDLSSQGDVFISSLFSEVRPEDSIDFTNVAGESGAIHVSSSDGNITLQGSVFTRNSTGGDAGSITLEADKDIQVGGTLFAISQVNCQGSVCFERTIGDGGQVVISSDTGLVTVMQDIDTRSVIGGEGLAGNGGNVEIKSQSSISTAPILTESRIFIPSNFSPSGDSQTSNSGDVSLVSDNGDVVSPSIFTRSQVDEIGIDNVGQSGDAGDVLIDSAGTVTTSINANSRVGDDGTTLNGNAGNGGNVEIFATGDIVLNRIETRSIVTGDGNTRNGGSIGLESSNGRITTDSLLAYSEVVNDGRAGDGGDILIMSGQDFIGTNIWTFSQSGNGGSNVISGSSGDISINSGGSINVTDGDPFGVILAVSQVRGDGNTNVTDSGDVGVTGSINLMSQGDIVVVSDFVPGDSTGQNSSIGNFSQVLGDGNTGATGNISLTSLEGNIVVGNIASNARLLGDGSLNGTGDITISAPNGSIRTGNIFAQSEVLGLGNATSGGSIQLQSQGDIEVSTLFSNSLSGGCPIDGCTDLVAGRGGDVEVTSVAGQLTFSPIFGASGIRTFSQVQTQGTAEGSGDISISTPTQVLNLVGVQISSNAFSGGDAGGIDINAQSVSLTETDITATSSGEGQGGPISIVADGTVALDRSRLFTSLELGAEGGGGSLSVTADSIVLDNFSLVDTTTFGLGNAGLVTITARDGITLARGSRVFSLTSGQGDGGDVRVQAGNNLTISGPSSISTIVSTGAQGEGGDVIVQADDLALVNGGQILSSNFSDGQAGNIEVDVTNQITITGSAVDFGATNLPDVVTVESPEVEESGLGANNVPETAPSLDPFFARTTTPDPNVEFSTQVPYVSVLGSLEAGNTNIDYYSFEVTAGTRAVFDVDTASTPSTDDVDTQIALFDSSGQQLASVGAFSTFNQDAAFSLGAGGSQVRLVAPSSGDLVNRLGGTSVISSDPFLRFIFSEPGRFVVGITRGPQTPSAAINYRLNVSLEAPPSGSFTADNLTSGLFARNDSELDAGVAGVITASASVLDLDDLGRIDTITLSGDGGDINLNLGNFLFLNQGSEISTTAGTAQMGGDGGSVFIEIPGGFIIGPPMGNADITANAFTGSGGQVNITAAGLFGIEFRDFPTLLSDITASSVLGPQGIVTIDLTEPDAQRGLNPLPEEPRNPQIADNCQNVGDKDAVELFDVGRGGLPPSPDDLLGADSASEFIPLIENKNSSNSTVVTQPEIQDTKQHNGQIHDSEIVKLRSLSCQK